MVVFLVNNKKRKVDDDEVDVSYVNKKVNVEGVVVVIVIDNDMFKLV